jgi:ABC-type amino acid transport substrate-binding protein
MRSDRPVAGSRSHAVPETVVCAHAAGFPPFAEWTAQGSSGIAVDVLREAADLAGLKLELVALPFEDLHAAAFDGRACAIFPVGVNADRNELFDFSDPLIVSGGGLFTRASEGGEAPSLDGLAGKVVTTPSAGPLVEIIRRSSPGVRLLPSANYEQSFEQLIDGRADIAALNLHVGKAMIAQRYGGLVSAPSSTFVDMPMAVAAPKNKQRWLIDRLNLALRRIRSADSCGDPGLAQRSA